MNDFQSRRAAIAEVAADWRSPDHPPREAAVEKTLEAPNRWTEEALDYALNRWMQRLTVEALDQWMKRTNGDSSTTVGVLHGDAEPLEGIRDAVAVWASGYAYLGHVSEASPALLRAFAEAVTEEASSVNASFASRTEVLGRATAVMAQPDRGDTEEFHEECDTHGIPVARRLARPPVHATAVLDGHERKGTCDRLAEDLLIYEGGGHRRLALLWAPQDLSPDPYLEAMARFRGAFPVHPDTPGALEMQKAFLEAQDEPHAYAEGLEFLVSRGTPEPRPQGHIRWTEYDTLDDVGTWMQDSRESFYKVVARDSLHDQLPDNWSVRTPGGLHVPPLDDEEGEAIIAFLRSLD